jgi:hypothetical protein
MAQKPTIILGVICIILVIGLTFVLLSYIPANDQINSLKTEVNAQNQTITSLDSQITILQAQINNQDDQTSNSEITSLQNEISDLENQIQILYNILYINASTTLISSESYTLDSATNITVWDQPDVPLTYAGVMTIYVSNASNLVFAQVTYSSYGVDYNEVKMLEAGSASFPILLGTPTLVLGTSSSEPITETVTLTYRY